MMEGSAAVLLTAVASFCSLCLQHVLQQCVVLDFFYCACLPAMYRGGMQNHFQAKATVGGSLHYGPMFCCGSGSLARVTLLFLCGLKSFRHVSVIRYESAMEMVSYVAPGAIAF